MSAPIGGDLEGYYRLHAPLYDLSRPLFLFGRQRLLHALRAAWTEPRAPSILEVGCGTGRNLAALARIFPDSPLLGLDLSPAMLDQARRRLGTRARLLHGALGRAALGEHDMVIASYMLSMTGSAQAACVEAARACLAPGGLLGVVDFLRTPIPAFARWMRLNHVRFEAELPSQLAAGLSSRMYQERAAYGGCWRYFLSIGQAPA